MTITVLVGRQNEGKTLAMTRLLLPDVLNGRDVYSNTYFAYPHIMINKDFLKDMVQKGIRLKNVSYALDEFWLWIDSRKRDTLMSYFYLQSSKDNANIYITAQTERQIDVRLRENLHYLGICERRIMVNGKLRKIPKEYRHKRVNLPQKLIDNLFIIVEMYRPRNSMTRSLYASDLELFKTLVIYAKPFFKMYDTHAKVKVKLGG